MVICYVMLFVEGDVGYGPTFRQTMKPCSLPVLNHPRPLLKQLSLPILNCEAPDTSRLVRQTFSVLYNPARSYS